MTDAKPSVEEVMKVGLLSKEQAASFVAWLEQLPPEDRKFWRQSLATAATLRGVFDMPEKLN